MRNITSSLECEDLTESFIKEKWVISEIMVSINCVTYNHGKYIRDALNGFVCQKTQFPFEVLVHDDASTDDTKEIILEYQRRFPTIIKPYFQRTNKYSQGYFISRFNYDRAQGKYIAICEGDDYWIDPYKLQRQFDILETNSQCDLCVHPAYGLNNIANAKKLGYFGRIPRVIKLESVILGGGGFFPTGSIFFRSKILILLQEYYLEYGEFGVGDVLLQFITSLNGGAFYTPEYASVYRIASDGSWSERMLKSRAFAYDQKLKLVEMNENINKFSNFKYDYLFKKKLERILITYLTTPRLDSYSREYLYLKYDKYLRKTSHFKIFIFTSLKSIKYAIKSILIILRAS